MKSILLYVLSISREKFRKIEFQSGFNNLIFIVMAFDGRLYRIYSAGWRRKGRAFYNFPGKKCLKYFKYSKFATDWMPAAKCTPHTFHHPFKGKVGGKFAGWRGRAAQKIRFEFHTGDYGCRFRPWRFDSIAWSTTVRPSPRDSRVSG